MKKITIISVLLILVLGSTYSVLRFTQNSNQVYTSPLSWVYEPTVVPSPTPTLIHTPTPLPLPENTLLQNDYHIYQTFNNCGPAALSMALSYYGIQVSQKELGDALRPYQVPNGDNDDKSVTLAEIARKAQEYGLISYHRPAGTADLIKEFLVSDMPVITRTWLKPNDDIGHYRIVKGYDDTTDEFIQDDSLQGKNLRYSYDSFSQLWKKFNYEYVVLVPREKTEIAKRILSDAVSEQKAWEKAVLLAQTHIAQDPLDTYAQFNLSVALFHVGAYAESVAAFERIETQLPFRMLWYQIEPITSYAALNNADRVFFLTDKILTNHNRAFSELYLLRGTLYKNQGNISKAREEFSKALTYNKHLPEAKAALASLPE